ncbi:MAG: altronate dehydratase family protein [Planctomycetia bacterium]|nr:altronate dehydratase family protein [Planctomycetia bacterium]
MRNATVDALHLHPTDNLAVATRLLESGEAIEVAGGKVKLRESVRLGHKFAVAPIAKGERTRKYGQTIGFATEPIEPGAWIHTHNCAAGEFARDYAFAQETPPDPQPLEGYTFQGYRRADGRVGTRNYVAVVSSVNCSATVCKYVAERFNRDLLKQFPNVDGVLPIMHQTGCGIQYGGEAHQMLARTLAGFAKHPNVGAYLIIGLGCETGTIGYLMEHEKLVQIGGPTPVRPPAISMQDVGGTAAAIEAGIQQLAALLPRANDVRRETVPASEIVLGLNCGGSDGNSGITANPALGVASDLLVAAGGTAMLAETPEIYGAEHLLTRRAKTRAIGEKLVERIKWWERYTGLFGVSMDNNPSPGNKEGGLTTIYEKSLGAVAKAGSTALAGVYEYAEPVTARGMVVVDTPGFDPVSVTGIVASGANVVCFTTGRGSCYGCQPTPSIKIASNTPMYERMQADMDLNAGEILRGEPIADVGKRIFDLILETASGRKTKSEELGIGALEFAPWNVGPTL